MTNSEGRLISRRKTIFSSFYVSKDIYFKSNDWYRCQWPIPQISHFCLVVERYTVPDIIQEPATSSLFCRFLRPMEFDRQQNCSPSSNGQISYYKLDKMSIHKFITKSFRQILNQRQKSNIQVWLLRSTLTCKLVFSRSPSEKKFINWQLQCVMYQVWSGLIIKQNLSLLFCPQVR